jgi:hypothetical protein
MNNNQTRRLAMLGRVINFRTSHAGDFIDGTTAAELLNTVAAAEEDATNAGTTQSSADGESRAGTATKAELYDSLLEDLRAISATAKPMSKSIPGLDEKFRVPRSISQANIITAARAFLKDATPLAAEFIKYELPADFVTDLENDIKAYDLAADDQGTGLGKRVGATRTLSEAISDGCEAVRDLDPLMKNKYKSDAATLAEWFTASHVERAARKAKTEVPAA